MAAEEYIVAAVLRQAKQDYKSGDSILVTDVELFLLSSWFADICDLLNINPEETRKEIRGGKDNL